MVLSISRTGGLGVKARGGGVRGLKKSLSVSGPARRAGPDDILGINFARTVREKIEVNFWPKINVNLSNS